MRSGGGTGRPDGNGARPATLLVGYDVERIPGRVPGETTANSSPP